MLDSTQPSSKSKKQRLKVVAFLPIFYGYGAAVNERQLLKTLSRKVQSILIFTLIGWKQVFTNQRKDIRLRLPSNVRIVPIPIPQINQLIKMAYSILISFLIAFITRFVDTIRGVDLIYIRHSWLSSGFLLSKKLRMKTIVKVMALVEDEHRQRSFSNRVVNQVTFHLDRQSMLKSKRVAVLSHHFGVSVIKSRSR